MPSGLLWLGLALGTTYSVAALSQPGLFDAALAADVTVLMGLFAAYVLYVALVARPAVFDDFLRAWTTLAVTTSVIRVLQAFHWFPVLLPGTRVPTSGKWASGCSVAAGSRATPIFRR